MKIRNLFLLAVASLMLAACNPTEDITLMSNIDQVPSSALAAAILSSLIVSFTSKLSDSEERPLGFVITSFHFPSGTSVKRTLSAA